MNHLYDVLLGGFLAVAGGLAGNLIPAFLQNRRERRVLAFSLAGEISAIVESIELRKYEQEVEALIQTVKTTKTPWVFTVRIEQSYFTIYEANASKIGLLPKRTAKDVAIFYTYAKSLVEDVTDNSFSPKTDHEAIQRLIEILDVFRLLLKLGHKVVKELESVDC